jgi:quercetin dioxygenase-like cupin family protein
MKNPISILFVVSGLLLVSSPVFAQQAKVTSLMSKPLVDNTSKELLMIAVEYPPGASDPVHRHNAQALLYVLEGASLWR